MTPEQNVTRDLLAKVETAYLVSYNIIDHELQHIIQAPVSEDLEMVMTTAGPMARAYAAPVKYSEIKKIVPIIWSQHMINTFCSTTTLINSYLRSMCRRGLTVQPIDDSWYSFNHVGFLSNVPMVDVSRYQQIVKMMEFIEYAYSNGSTKPVQLINHLDIVRAFDDIRVFIDDFELAYFLANPNVKE